MWHQLYTGWADMSFERMQRSLQTVLGRGYTAQLHGQIPQPSAQTTVDCQAA